MKITPTALPEVKLVEIPCHADARGFFAERFHAEKFAEAGLPAHFVQDNFSRSLPGVLRGIHYQSQPAQGKLVGLVRGKVWDVAVDLRVDSPNFGRHVAVTLDAAREGVVQLCWIPPGFGHGFCVLGDVAADMYYKVTAPYHAAGEGGIRHDDRELDIRWPVRDPLISERDATLPTLADYRAAPPRWAMERS